jgi:hypothetical protein
VYAPSPCSLSHRERAGVRVKFWSLARSPD